MATRRAFGRLLLSSGACLTAAPRWLHGQQPGAEEFTGAGSLKNHAAAHGLYTGAAVNVALMRKDAKYRQTLIEQYNIVVAERSMKWGPLRPTPTTFFWGDADALVDFAERHGMAIRGHNLCWHEALPTWFASTVNKGNAERFLTDHIRTVVGRYKGKIRAWDVVNEAIEPKDGLPEGYRNGPWYQFLGPRFIDIAFRTAREADPHALLTYNDYSIETDSAEDTKKREAIAALVERMRDKGVPIDAVGVQSHISATSAAQIDGGLSHFVAHMQGLGLKVFITELDVNDDGLAANEAAAREKTVAGIYGSYVTGMLRHKAVTDVLTWGTANRWSWLNAPAPYGVKFRPKHPGREEVCLPFDNNYQPLPAFYALRRALDSRAL